MKILFIVISIIMFFPLNAYSHGTEDTHVLYINGKGSEVYHIGERSNFYFVPLHKAPENYLVNEPIRFELNENVLIEEFPHLYQELKEFKWEFGDGFSAKGLINTHTYTKPGTYFLNIKMVYTDTQETSNELLAESVVLHILPDKTYKLPQAALKINDEMPPSIPINSPLKTDLRQPVKLDASDSKPGSGEIVEFIWDLGDETSADQKTFYYKYPPEITFPVVKLRVKDKNGFVSDGYWVLLHDENSANLISSIKTGLLTNHQSNVIFSVIYSIGGIIVLIAIFIALRSLLKIPREEETQ